METFTDVLRILEEQEDSSDLLVWNTRLYHKLVRNASRKKEPAASEVPDFSDIIGQEGAKRGLEIAAAGGHNVMELCSSFRMYNTLIIKQIYTKGYFAES